MMLLILSRVLYLRHLYFKKAFIEWIPRKLGKSAWIVFIERSYKQWDTLSWLRYDWQTMREFPKYFQKIPLRKTIFPLSFTKNYLVNELSSSTDLRAQHNWRTRGHNWSRIIPWHRLWIQRYSCSEKDKHLT